MLDIVTPVELTANHVGTLSDVGLVPAATLATETQPILPPVIVISEKVPAPVFKILAVDVAKVVHPHHVFPDASTWKELAETKSGMSRAPQTIPPPPT